MAYEYPDRATIRRLRSHRHITQEQLAAYLGVTPQAVSRWEAGNGYPDMETLPALSDYFSISADELLGIRKEGREERLEEIKRELSVWPKSAPGRNSWSLPDKR